MGYPEVCLGPRQTSMIRGNFGPKLRPAFGCCHHCFIFSEICFTKNSVNVL